MGRDLHRHGAAALTAGVVILTLAALLVIYFGIFLLR